MGDTEDDALDQVLRDNAQRDLQLALILSADDHLLTVLQQNSCTPSGGSGKDTIAPPSDEIEGQCDDQKEIEDEQEGALPFVHPDECEPGNVIAEPGSRNEVESLKHVVDTLNSEAQI